MSTDRLRLLRGAVASPGFVLPLLLVSLLLLLAGTPRAALAQDDLEDVLGGLGTAERVEDDEAPAGQREGEGTVRGRVFDGEAGTPVRGVTVIIVWPQDGPDSGRQEIAITDGEGFYEFPSIPAGRYDVSFVKSGYRTSAMKNFAVNAGAVNPADFPLPPLPTGTSDQILQLDEYVVEASTVGDMMDALELRMDSDQLLNIMSAEDLSKYAAGDVADALKRVAGVNVVEGQFAIIRGLEDRYSSTLYNGAPVPSPNPDRQSVPLDLFPAEIVNDLVIAKTFAPDLPSNSAGGAIDIITHAYPDEPFTITLATKGGINENAWDEFLEYQSGSPVGKPIDGVDTTFGELSGSIGGRTEFWKRELRYKAIGNWQSEYDTADGFQEGREPANRGSSSHFPAGDLAFGELSLTAGRFDLTESEYNEGLTLYGGFGFDVDERGDHKIDASAFWTRNDTKVVSLRDNGYFPGFDYSILPELEEQNEDITIDIFDGANGAFAPGQVSTADAWMAKGVRIHLRDGPERGSPWLASFYDSRSFKIQRDLLVTQVNGDHELAAVDGLHLSWAANYATTSQDDAALGARFYFEPCGLAGQQPLPCPSGVLPITSRSEPLPTGYPLSPEDLGPGYFVANRGLFSNANQIDEDQYFSRADGEYERELGDWLAAVLRTGIWYEHAKRDVSSSFLNGDAVSVGCTVADGCIGGGTQFAIFADTAEELGEKIFSTALLRTDGEIAGLIATKNESKREIKAWNLNAKATLWDWFDVFAGVRLENIYIESVNDPFTEGVSSLDSTPLTFPSKYLFFDRIDNLVRERFPQPPPFNDELLGLDPAIGPCRDQAGAVIPDGQPGAGQCVDLINQAEIQDAVNGEIDDNRALPSAGLAFRPYEWLTLRGAYSQTVARPSFREMGFYVTVEPGTDDLTIGNPQLGLSDVESFDGRVEVVWGDMGDLFAFSGFYKTIQDPIEQIILRDPSIFEATATDTFRTFFNNPNEATLWGVEVEGRKNLGFLGFDLKGLEFLEHLSVGGNYTYISAEVDRSEAELQRSEVFFGNAAGTPFPELKKSRRLFGQPEWIANADLSLDQRDWGTKATIAFFAISDVLDAAGAAVPDRSGFIKSFTLDRYVGSYHTLDLIVSQKVWDGVSIKFTAKNLTDSKRSIHYDRQQTTTTVKERQYQVGRAYTVELKYVY